jgi:hypothetical protein
MGPGGKLLDGAKVCFYDPGIWPITILTALSDSATGHVQQRTAIAWYPHTQHIKNEWQCQQHLGENGRPGACYITPSGKHVGLNIRHLAAWAAAMVRHSIISVVLFITHRNGLFIGCRRGNEIPATQHP